MPAHLQAKFTAVAKYPLVKKANWQHLILRNKTAESFFVFFIYSYLCHNFCRVKFFDKKTNNDFLFLFNNSVQWK